MIAGLEQVEDSLKHGYLKAILGFVKSKVNNTTSYFIEITKGVSARLERIYISKHDYVQAQDLLDKYNELHKMDKDKEKEKRLQKKEARAKKIQEMAEKKAKEFIEGDLQEKNDELEDSAIEEDPKSELVLGAEPIEEDEEEIDEPENENDLYNENKPQGEVNEPNQP